MQLAALCQSAVPGHVGGPPFAGEKRFKLRFSFADN